MPLFMIDQQTGEVSAQKPVFLADLGVKERQHLERWIADTPQVVGGQIVVVDTEFDRFEKTKERIDILGMTTTPEGRLKLVIIELKRTEQSTTMDLQAIKYAAYCSRFTFARVCAAHAQARNIDLDKARGPSGGAGVAGERRGARG